MRTIYRQEIHGRFFAVTAFGADGPDNGNQHLVIIRKMTDPFTQPEFVAFIGDWEFAALPQVADKLSRRDFRGGQKSFSASVAPMLRMTIHAAGSDWKIGIKSEDQQLAYASRLTGSHTCILLPGDTDHLIDLINCVSRLQSRGDEAVLLADGRDWFFPEVLTFERATSEDIVAGIAVLEARIAQMAEMAEMAEMANFTFAGDLLAALRQGRDQLGSVVDCPDCGAPFYQPQGQDWRKRCYPCWQRQKGMVPGQSEIVPQTQKSARPSPGLSVHPSYGQESEPSWIGAFEADNARRFREIMNEEDSITAFNTHSTGDPEKAVQTEMADDEECEAYVNNHPDPFGVQAILAEQREMEQARAAMQELEGVPNSPATKQEHSAWITHSALDPLAESLLLSTLRRALRSAYDKQSPGEFYRCAEHLADAAENAAKLGEGDAAADLRRFKRLFAELALQASRA